MNKKVISKIFKWLGVVFLAAATVLVVFMFIQRIANNPANPPSLFGYRVFQVLTPSMEPELMVDDVIIVKKIDPGEVKKDDIVSYFLKEDTVDGLKAGSIITHKVVEEPYEENGVYHFQTQGIKAGAIPDKPITGDQILGRYTVKVPLMKYLYNFFTHWYGLIVFLLVLLLLFGKEALNLRNIIKAKPEDFIEEESNEEIKFEDIPKEELEKILKSQGYVKEEKSESSEPENEE